MKITIKTIPHDQQRYPTVGDWQFTQEPFRLSSGRGPTLWHDKELKVRVSKMSDERYEFLVGIHEAIEAFLCKAAGVSEEAVDRFDTEYEKNRSPEDNSEPGDTSTAPYYRQHQIATGIERILAAELGVDWKQYEAEIESL